MKTVRNELTTPEFEYADATLARKLAFLSDPRAYPVSPLHVEVVETHMSLLFLVDGEVYKLKKSVRLPFLDFTTLESREFNCREEVRLNQRLAPGVYLGVEPLVRTAHGGMQLGGDGAIVDWLVRMRRLPADRMLDRLMRERRLQAGELCVAATRLANFYARAPSAGYAAHAYRERFLRLIDENHRVLSDPQWQLSPAQCVHLSSAQHRFVNSHGSDLEGRARHVVEAHGDLRPEHICLVDPPVIIDCLEFNREFRLLDPADELAFLKLECEMAGAAYVGDLFLATCLHRLGDNCPAHVLAFYQAVRALVKAKLAVWHLPDDPRQERGNWLQTAARYLDRAEHYLAGFKPG